MSQLRDSNGRFARQQEPGPGPLWIEAPTDPCAWSAAGSCHVVDFRRPKPDPSGEGGQGFEVLFTGTFAECDSWLEAFGAQRGVQFNGGEEAGGGNAVRAA